MTMTENTKLWDILGRTDPKHTKPFTRGGGFKGTALKPMWSYRRLTEEFGPCGEGWGIGEPSFQIVNGDNREILVYCTTSAWYRWNGETRTVHGVGGDKIVSHIKANAQYNRPERWENDDEAFKKAFTDAVTNAFKLIGVGADIHMGMFDDSKYVNAMREEFADEAPSGTPNTVTGPAIKSSAQLKRDGNWDKLMMELSLDFGDCHTRLALEKIKKHYRERAQAEGWTKAWMSALKNEFDNFENTLPDGDDDTFPGDLPSKTQPVNVLAGG
jgi:hypothetical protein